MGLRLAVPAQMPMAIRASFKLNRTPCRSSALPVVYPKSFDSLEDLGNLAPEAGYLLTVAFPSLTLQQADRILTESEGPGGGFLHDGSSSGVYSRINLYAAAGRAEALVRELSSGVRRTISPQKDKTAKDSTN